jgi:hypothetical protein
LKDFPSTCHFGASLCDVFIEIQKQWIIYTTGEPTMKYLLLMYANESEAPQSPEELEAVASAWYAYMGEGKAAGVLLSNNGLEPGASATTLRIRNGKSLITDGPFAETHEQLGGYSLLDCKDLDEAIRWAEKIPTAKYGSVEIRPLWSPTQ